MLKSTFTSLAFALAIGATPVLAQQAGKPRVQSGQVKVKGADVRGTDVAKEMNKQDAQAAQAADQAVEQIAQAAAGGKVDGPWTKRLEQALAKDPSLEPMRARLEAYVASLREQAEKGEVAREDFQRLRTGMIDARFESAFEELQKKVQARGASEADFDQLAALLVERSLAAKGLALDLGKHQQRLAQAIAKLKERNASGELTTEELQGLHDQVSVARTDAELGDLEQQIAAGRATAADFEGARVQIRRRAAALRASTGSDGDFEARMTEALAKIQKQSEEGQAVPAEEFAALRKGLTRRAQEAGAPR